MLFWRFWETVYFDTNMSRWISAVYLFFVNWLCCSEVHIKFSVSCFLCKFGIAYTICNPLGNTDVSVCECVANLYPYGQALPDGISLSFLWHACYASGGRGCGDGDGAVGHMLAGWAVDLSVRCLDGCCQGPSCYRCSLWSCWGLTGLLLRPG